MNNQENPASPASVPEWVPSDDEVARAMQLAPMARLWFRRELEAWDDLDPGFQDDLRAMARVAIDAVASRTPLPAPQPSVEDLARKMLQAAQGDKNHWDDADEDYREEWRRAARVAMESKPQPSVEVAARALVEAHDNLQGTPHHEESMALYFAEDQYEKAWDDLRAALSALPASEAPLGTLPSPKTLNECREVFRRVAKRGPCLSSPDLHGIAAVRDFLTLDEVAFRHNWGDAADSARTTEQGSKDALAGGMTGKDPKPRQHLDHEWIGTSLSSSYCKRCGRDARDGGGGPCVPKQEPPHPSPLPPVSRAGETPTPNLIALIENERAALNGETLAHPSGSTSRRARVKSALAELNALLAHRAPSIEDVVDALLRVTPYKLSYETGASGLVYRADVEQVMRALFDRRSK